jgi:hypothetical protein
MSLGVVAAGFALCTLTADAAVPSAPPSSVEASKSEAESFSAELKGAASYEVGKEGVVEVVLLAKGEYKINPQFPIRFKMADPPDGVSYPKPVLKREDGSFADKQGSFKVPFVASKAGTVRVAGTLSLSVCTDKKCLMEKVSLDLDVTVR